MHFHNSWAVQRGWLSLSLTLLSWNTAKCECLAHSQGPPSRQGDREGATLSLCQCLLPCSCQLPAGMTTRCSVPRTDSYGHLMPMGRKLGNVGKFRASLPSPRPLLIHGLALPSFTRSFNHSSYNHSLNTRQPGWSSVRGSGDRRPCPCWDRNRNGQRVRDMCGCRWQLGVEPWLVLSSSGLPRKQTLT